MPSNIGATRKYTDVEEGRSIPTQKCDRCKVNVVPRGITSTTRYASGEKHCPNCGHIFGRKNQ